MKCLIRHREVFMPSVRPSRVDLSVPCRVALGLLFVSGLLFSSVPPWSPAHADCVTPQRFRVCPGDYETIAAAMAAAAACDTILVCDGTFPIGSEIQFKSGVILRSDNGRDATTLQWTGIRGRILNVNGAVAGSKIGIESETSGFTFKGGNPADGQSGGAVKVTSSHLVIQHCRFDSNRVTNSTGGAIHAQPGISKSFLIDRCEFTANSAVHDDTTLSVNGGAVYLRGCDDAEIRACTFEGNLAECGAVDPTDCMDGAPHAAGGALYVTACPDFILQDCVFDGNSSFDAGAFCYWMGTGGEVPLLIKGNSFRANRAARNGGAIVFDHGDWGIRNCIFEANEADSAGGAVFVLDSTGFIKGCSFTRNRVTGKGDTKYFNGGGAVGLRATGGCAVADTFSIEACRFDSCSSVADGGSVYLHQAYEWILRDSAIRSSHAGGDGGGVFLANAPPGQTCSYDTTFIETCHFQNCSTSGRGGAVFIEAGNAILEDVRLLGCCADDGGAVYYGNNTHAPMTWSNLTLAGNAGKGAALFLDRNLDLSVTRSIFSMNDGGLDSIIRVGASVDGSFDCCDFFGNSPGYVPACDSCFAADPLFCDSEDLDASLTFLSPCNEGNHPDGKNCGIIGVRSLCEHPSAELTWLNEGEPTTNYSQSDTLRVGAFGDTAVGFVSFGNVWIFPGARVDSAMVTGEVVRVAGMGSDSVTVHASLRAKAVTGEATWYVYRLGSTWGRPGAGQPDGDYGAGMLGIGGGFQEYATDTLALSADLGRWVEDEVLGQQPLGTGRLVLRPRGTKDVTFHWLILRVWSSIP